MLSLSINIIKPHINCQHINTQALTASINKLISIVFAFHAHSYANRVPTPMGCTIYNFSRPLESDAWKVVPEYFGQSLK